ncbi:MAG TPA: sulfate ABC transporter permease subunit [Nocardioides sp.]|uniref:sulfate ABC transporter permease n=1 Tax=Nocardioides sp. TaxID=35761 RepID=UPI002F41F797
MVELPRPASWTLRLVAAAYVFFLVGWPVIALAQRTFADGLAGIDAAMSDPDVTHALLVTAEISLWAVAINTVFGVGMALLLVRHEFPGRRLLSALVDLPMSVSPVVIGLALLLVYNGRTGWFGPTLESHGLVVIFNSPGMIMATCFVALPLVVREVVPVLEEIGDDQEQAARSLGASALQTLRRITLPAVKWAVVYGVVLSLARSLGEFGALKIVSGNLTGQTQTAPLVVEQKYTNFAQNEAYAVSFLLVLVSVLFILVVSLLRPKESTTS